MTPVERAQVEAWVQAAPPEVRAWVARLMAQARRGRAAAERLTTVTRERDLSRCHVQDLVRTLRDSRRLPEIAALSAAATHHLDS